MRIYDTMTKGLSPLLTLSAHRLTMFVCGPTVYDYAHLGHAKTYTQFDMMVRYWRQKGMQVVYLQNITDIDDKIIQRAKEKGQDPLALARYYEEAYKTDMKALGNTSVDIYARATDHIDGIVSQIERLLALDVAYRIEDGYYFDITSFQEYGCLSLRCAPGEHQSFSRIDESVKKRNPGDFCLWKFEKPGEPVWETVLGRGRPGWHVEDTAITEHYFGPQYDLHGGAIDLIFPHHEAEIAIMESVSGKKPLVQQWIHTGFLNMKSEKMSKSLGNFITIRQALDQVDPKILRYIFVSTHYQSTIELTQETLAQSRSTLERIHIFLKTIDKEGDDAHLAPLIGETREKFYQHMDHNFDSPAAMAEVFNLMRQINGLGNPGKRTACFMEMLEEIFACFYAQESMLDGDIEELLQKREGLRKEKRWQEADDIRKTLIDRGVILEDTPQGLRWRKKL